MHEDPGILKNRAKHLSGQLRKRCGNISISAIEVYSEAGGGSFPDVIMPSYGISIKPPTISVENLEERLRNLEIPIIGRIEKEALIIDMRTILKEEETLLVSGLETALKDAQ
jgi:L-seryl-tRNA(Ser) seleniumtransferase